jgi:hypothetical protein
VECLLLLLLLLHVGRCMTLVFCSCLTWPQTFSWWWQQQQWVHSAATCPTSSAWMHPCASLSLPSSL